MQHVEIHLITTDAGNGKQKMYIPNVNIHREAKWQSDMSRTSRLFLYLRFFICAFLRLSKVKPSALLYYETVSAAAPYFYNRWLNSSCRIFIHYHEYISPGEYSSGPIFNRWLHRLEKHLYKKSYWVSHTNEDRMRLFIKDLGKDAPTKTYILPNYPPASWAKTGPVTIKDGLNRIGFVYVGALSSETMYFKEMANFISSRPSECYWDIYSDNYSPEIIQYLDSVVPRNIHFKGFVKYDQLPDILPKYRIGLVLYKGHIPNYTYNIPNKLFEYHVCGLDVWFPKQMVTSDTLSTKGTYPKISSVDFEKLERISLSAMVDRSGLEYRKNEFICENTYEPLIRELLNEKNALRITP